MLACCHVHFAAEAARPMLIPPDAQQARARPQPPAGPFEAVDPSGRFVQPDSSLQDAQLLLLHRNGSERVVMRPLRDGPHPRRGCALNGTLHSHWRTYADGEPMPEPVAGGSKIKDLQGLMGAVRASGRWGFAVWAHTLAHPHSGLGLKVADRFDRHPWDADMWHSPMAFYGCAYGAETCTEAEAKRAVAAEIADLAGFLAGLSLQVVHETLAETDDGRCLAWHPRRRGFVYRDNRDAALLLAYGLVNLAVNESHADWMEFRRTADGGWRPA